METALAVIPEQNSAQLTRRASDAAGVCKAIVLKTVKRIGQKDYVQVEGWQSIANALGCVASARDVEHVEGGIRAIGEVRRMDTNMVISTAEGFVGDDEKTWAARPMYARRAMAQTRAISRACRSAFAFVVTMMDAGLETTPAEEVDENGFPVPPTVKQTQRKSAAAASSDPKDTPPLKNASAAAADLDETIEFIPTLPDKRENKKKPNTFRYVVKLPDGREASTFDEKIGTYLNNAANAKVMVHATLEQCGKYTNITQVSEAL